MLSNKIGFMMDLSAIRFIIGVFTTLLKEAGEGEWLVKKASGII